MAITVTIKQVERPDLEQLRLVVEFSQGALVISREYRLTTSDDLTAAGLKARLKADRDALTALATGQTALTALINQPLTL